jgi:hypothetical protein
MADVGRLRVQGAQRRRIVHERAIDVDVARQQVAVFRGEIGRVEIGKARHAGSP